MSDTKKTTASKTYGETATVYLGAIQSKAPENFRPYIEKATPFIAIVANMIEKLIPVLIIYYQKVYILLYVVNISIHRKLL